MLLEPTPSTSDRRRPKTAGFLSVVMVSALRNAVNHPTCPLNRVLVSGPRDRRMTKRMKETRRARQRLRRRELPFRQHTAQCTKEQSS